MDHHVHTGNPKYVSYLRDLKHNFPHSTPTFKQIKALSYSFLIERKFFGEYRPNFFLVSQTEITIFYVVRLIF